TPGALIEASNIFNYAGGLLSTVLPAGGLPGVVSPVSSLSLSLSAIKSIVNAGTITSAGNVNLSSAQGKISNSGLIASVNGNVNLSTGQSGSNLTVANSGGTIQALNGYINVRDAGFQGTANTTLAGGDWLSQQLNINGGCGRASLDVGNITG